MSARNGPMKENVYPTKLTWIRSAPIPARRVKPAQVSIPSPGNRDRQRVIFYHLSDLSWDERCRG